MNIFISHIHEEDKLAQELKKGLKKHFGELIDVFLAEEIPLGTNWFNEIKKSLNKTDVILVLFSYQSLKREWINIEAGYGIMNDKIVIPILSGGLKKKSLPIVYSLYQAVEINKVIDIQMQSEPINEGVSGVSDSLSGLVDRLKESFKGVQLRGSIYENGMLHSFWVKSNQKNLLCMLFEIPPYPLKEGDEWTLRNVNLISNDHNFVCEKAKHINKVKLTIIEKRGDDRIAILDYNIYEYVEGTFGKTAPDGLEMELRFKGRAKFSVNLGRWIDYEGILSYVSSGYLTANSKQKIALKLEN